MGIAAKLARLIADSRNPAFVTHSVDDILRARILAITCGYEDADDDLDHLRTDPAFKLACNCLADSGGDLRSQPTVSRWENAPTQREVVRMIYARIDLYCASYARPPAAVTLDIDDIPDIVHGHQQLALFNSHCGERCCLAIHVYDTMSTTRRQRGRWRCCCGPARRRLGTRSVAILAVRYAASASIGPTPA